EVWTCRAPASRYPGAGIMMCDDGLRAPDERRDLSDDEIVARVRAGERSLFAVVMRRYNRRLYRIVRAITGEDGLAEAPIRAAYVRACGYLDELAGRPRPAGRHDRRRTKGGTRHA